MRFRGTLASSLLRGKLVVVAYCTVGALVGGVLLNVAGLYVGVVAGLVAWLVLGALGKRVLDRHGL